MARKYKKVSECPLPELEDLIYQVNLVPPDFQMESLEFYQDLNMTAVIALNHCLKNAPPKLVEHLEFTIGADTEKSPFDQATAEYYLKKMLLAYTHYHWTRTSMIHLLERLEVESQYPKDTILDWSEFPLILRTPVIRDATGKLQQTGLSSILGNFDDSRLRRCKVCKYVFWAKKKNAETCGNKKCAEKLGNKKRLDEARELKEKHNNHFQSRVKK